MILLIRQTASNISQEFEIYADDRYLYGGALGRWHRYQAIRLWDNKGKPVMQGEYLMPWQDGQMGEKGWLSQGCRITRGEVDAGNFVYVQESFKKSHYRITLPGDKTIEVYARDKGAFEYLSVYDGEQQIALVEIYLTTEDYKYTYKLYLLETHDELGDILALFILYYANWNYAKRFHMSKGSMHVRSWSYSAYNDRYDPTWRERHFPRENFFGKVGLFDEE